MKTTVLKRRLHAWWNGYDAPEVKLRAPFGAGGDAEEPGATESTRRLACAHVAELLWGRGTITPGDADFVVDLVKLLSPDETMTLAEFGAGLGSSCRAISKQTGIWTTGFEESPELAEAGMELSVGAGMRRKAPIGTFDPMQPLDLKSQSTNIVLCKEYLFTLADKRRFLAEVHRVLKPHGSLVLTDYMLQSPQNTEQTLARWAPSEPRKPLPWTRKAYEVCLLDLGFTLNISKTLTEEYKRMVAHAWSEFQQQYQADSLPNGEKGVFLSELAMWAGRLHAIANGALGVGCVVAYKS